MGKDGKGKEHSSINRYAVGLRGIKAQQKSKRVSNGKNREREVEGGAAAESRRRGRRLCQTFSL